MIVRPDGTFDVLAIKPGWGSSGYYSKEVLKRDAAQIVPTGLHFYANHQTAQEAKDRPEGSIHDLMAVAATAGEYRDNGPLGPGVYARAKALPHYAGYIEALAPHIGVSIRAIGDIEEAGEAEGRRGTIVRAITTPVSLDFVTKPGAGGRVLEILESARAGVPLVPADPPAQPEGGSTVSDTDAQALRESADALREQVQAMERKLAEAAARQAELAEALIKRDIDRVLVETLATAQVHPMVRERLTRDLKLVAPVTEGALDEAKFRTMIGDRLKGELAYISETSGVQPGQIRGLGPSVREEADAAQAEAALAESLAGLGLSTDAARLAAAGRR